MLVLELTAKQPRGRRQNAERELRKALTAGEASWRGTYVEVSLKESKNTDMK